MVEQIEELGAKLDGSGFADRGVLDQREVDVLVTRTVQEVAARITEAAEGRDGEGGGVEPKLRRRKQPQIFSDATDCHGSRLCPFGLAPGIPPTAVGGWLRFSLQAAATFFNPLNGSWGMVKVQPSRPLEQFHLGARRLDFNHPPTAVGGD